MTDIVERLRKWSVFGYGYEASCDMKEAATAIEAQSANMANAARLLSEQTAEIERLRAALRGAEAWLQNWAVHAGRCEGGNGCTCGLTAIRYDLSAALEERT